ncbi:hypothetical protein JCM8208_001876 [Rhodotorula glutinis]
MLAAVSLALAALSAVTAAPVPVVESSVALPNSTQVNATAYWYTQDGRAGACGSYSSDADVVVGLPLEFYAKYDAVSPYCGSFVVVKGDHNKTVTALVADASTLNDTLTLSVAAWRSLDGDAGLTTVDWRFANETEAAAAAKALKDSPATSVVETPAAATSAKAPSWTSSHAAATPSSSSSAEHTAAATTSPAAEKKESSTASSSAAWASPSASSSAWHSSSASSSSAWSSEHAAPLSSSSAEAEKKVATSSSSAWAPEHSSTSTSTKEWKESSTSSYEAPKTTTTVKPSTTTTTSQWVAPKTTTTQAPKTTQQASSASSGTYSGSATFYSQGGAAGSCGNYASDSDYVVAVNAAQMNSGWCGRTVKITNKANGATITAKVADTCPGCSYGSLDLSTGAFGAIGNYDTGVLSINWNFSGGNN